MFIVTMPLWAWLIYLPLHLTWRLTYLGCLLALRLTAWSVRRVARAGRAHAKRRRAARSAIATRTAEHAS